MAHAVKQVVVEIREISHVLSKVVQWNLNTVMLRVTKADICSKQMSFLY